MLLDAMASAAQPLSLPLSLTLPSGGFDFCFKHFKLKFRR